MSTLKIQIVEDEIVIADSIYDTLEELGYQPLEPVINYTEALAQARDESPDLALLDVQLAGKKDGIDLAQVYREEFDFPFIFLTSNAESETLRRAKPLKPAAYLIKPFGKKDLFAAIEMALDAPQAEEQNEEQKSSDPDVFFVKDKNFYQKLRYSDLLYIKSDHVYLELYLVNGLRHVIRKSLSEFESTLPPQFQRVHRSYIVNIDFMQGINSHCIKVEGDEIPIGQSYRDELFKKFAID